MSNLTGTYAVVDGSVQKVSDSVPTLARPVYFNKGSVPRYDPSAQTTFESKEQKRQWLKSNGMREGGIITGTKRWDGPVKNAHKYNPTGEQRRLSIARKSYIQSQGGVNGLLDKFEKQGEGNGSASG